MCFELFLFAVMERNMTQLKTSKNMDKPYEKFMTLGPAALTDEELLAIIIRTGTNGLSAVELSKKILNLSMNCKGLLGLYHLQVSDLMSVKGIGSVKAIKIKCIAELSMRIARTAANNNIVFSTPASIANYFMEEMRHLEVENVILLLLDNKNGMIGKVLLSKGTVNASIVSTREIFLHALQFQATNIVLLHNHPSGSIIPSEADIALTKKITSASKIMNIPLIDHIIIGDLKFTSLAEQGYIERGK